MKFLTTFKVCKNCGGGLIHDPPDDKDRPHLIPTIQVYPSIAYWKEKARSENWPVCILHSFKCIECGKQSILEEIPRAECFEIEEIVSEINSCR